jgi:hypothetical protein
MKGIIKNRKAMVLLFALTFLLFISGSQKEGLSDFIEINISETQVTNFEYNLEQLIRNQLGEREEDEDLIKKKVNYEILNYLQREENIKVKMYDLKENKEEKLSFSRLQETSKVIIYKPSKNIIVKKYIITNGINKNLFLRYSITTNNYFSQKTLPANYSVMVITYT